LAASVLANHAGEGQPGVKRRQVGRWTGPHPRPLNQCWGRGGDQGEGATDAAQHLKATTLALAARSVPLQWRNALEQMATTSPVSERVPQQPVYTSAHLTMKEDEIADILAGPSKYDYYASR
jgi:hypothetical protein